MAELKSTKKIILYTMTSGLGDYLIMGDVMRKARQLLPQTECIMAHRASPHVTLWPYGAPAETFCNVCDFKEVLALIRRLRRAKREGTKIFGLQMAPGSLQGYFWYSFLKRTRALDYIVDFNLVNADVITSPRGKYILDWQLNQLQEIFKVSVPDDFYQLNIPVKWDSKLFNTTGTLRIGIHPWSRRGQYPCFVWTDDKWIALISEILKTDRREIVVFGRDPKFKGFQDKLLAAMPENRSRITFCITSSVPHLIEAINTMDLLISVNTSVVHIAQALKKRIVILNGPTFHPWIPTGAYVRNVYDRQSEFGGVDRCQLGEEFPTIARIEKSDVLAAVKQLLT